ncbi:MAG: TIR domain-containing protein [Nitrosopumilaceae archaeon]|nr:TIR domain-containing protein [Nitrosopumilaceae archaeon]NIU01284.1 TIR domain-containing protein [Nitrosopumilaceae archaeon]NIU87632.1 TIR domain-containing protein [Nitrosopumilaceae archaeon]NIV66057.1 TIR domain-containing protein [Nitrosopumilaceae archaeon]NIX61886.1 TIR domain-containing protein [Nitrosopumilaceae archaeon]
MTTIFISHSKRDEELVLNVKRILENVGHTPIIEEFVPPNEQSTIPYEEIRTNVENSGFVFLFLTDNVVKTEYTKNWVIYEVGVASANSKRIFVFERIGNPIPYPIPHVTDYALFDPNKTDNILGIQSLAKNLDKFRKDILTAGGGALVGSLFGPLGMLVGAGLGFLLGPKDDPPPTVQCPHCSVSFNYYSDITQFNCPCCRKGIDRR